MSVTLRQMTYALALAETGHFGRAAEQCHVTQPALSQQIRQLEEICGAPLFDRLGKSVRLTPLGREFVERARPIVEQSDGLTTFIAGKRGRPDRALRFGLIPTVAPYLLPDIFPALTRDLPDLSFTISESRTDMLIEAIEDGSLDLALIATEPRPGAPKLISAPLFSDAFMLATPASEAAAGPVELDQIEGERMLLLDEGHCFRAQTIAACRLDPEASRRTFAATSLSTIVEFVANGQGVTLLPEIALRKEATDGRIAVHTLQSPGASRLLRLVWREAAPYAAVLEEVAAVIRRTRAQPV
jgi:LysR family hydrogen peroxide-inducible transcriptional activator